MNTELNVVLGFVKGTVVCVADGAKTEYSAGVEALK